MTQHGESIALPLQIGQWRRRRLDLGDAVEDPGVLVGRRYGRRVADGEPHQATEGVIEAGDRVPGRRGRRLEAELQPAVPGKVLELHGAQEHRRVEALECIEGDVLDAGRELGAEVFALHV